MTLGYVGGNEYVPARSSYAVQSTVTAGMKVALMVLLLFIVIVVLFVVLDRSPLQFLNCQPVSGFASIFTIVPERYEFPDGGVTVPLPTLLIVSL